MSLDVSLHGPSYEKECTCLCGHEHKSLHTERLFSANITHNLNTMASQAGIYEALWRPEEIGITKASQLIPILEKGLEKLQANPAQFRVLNPCNGWGSYDGFVPWVREYLEACKRYPDATVEVSR